MSDYVIIKWTKFHRNKIGTVEIRIFFFKKKIPTPCVMLCFLFLKTTDCRRSRFLNTDKRASLSKTVSAMRLPRNRDGSITGELLGDAEDAVLYTDSLRNLHCLTARQHHYDDTVIAFWLTYNCKQRSHLTFSKLDYHLINHAIVACVRPVLWSRGAFHVLQIPT